MTEECARRQIADLFGLGLDDLEPTKEEIEARSREELFRTRLAGWMSGFADGLTETGHGAGWLPPGLRFEASRVDRPCDYDTGVCACDRRSTCRAPQDGARWLTM